jgi:hypothetical protein
MRKRALKLAGKAFAGYSFTGDFAAGLGVLVGW